MIFEYIQDGYRGVLHVHGDTCSESVTAPDATILHEATFPTRNLGAGDRWVYVSALTKSAIYWERRNKCLQIK